MTYEVNFYGSTEVAQQLGIELNALQAWLHRHPEYRPQRRFSGDDLLWTPEDIDRVRQARQRTAKHGNRKSNVVG
jgi:hypothetical protein